MGPVVTTKKEVRSHKAIEKALRDAGARPTRTDEPQIPPVQPLHPNQPLVGGAMPMVQKPEKHSCGLDHRQAGRSRKTGRPGPLRKGAP